MAGLALPDALAIPLVNAVGRRKPDDRGLRFS